jgi:hypothetical protein
MRIEQRTWSEAGWSPVKRPLGSRAQLALAFAPITRLTEHQTWAELIELYPGARIVGCSTAGEIAGARVLDDALVATAIAFDHSGVAVAQVELDEAASDAERGALLTSRLPHDGLIHVLVLSTGNGVDGSALIAGITAGLPPGVAVTGGLAGDGAGPAASVVCLDGPKPCEQIVAIGFYGDRLRVGYGSLAGWDPFGPERRITRSDGNVLIELDGEPALDLYKRYLGADATGLPASAAGFPLAIRSPSGRDLPVVRGIRSIDEAAHTLTFGGDLPSGYRARLMRARFDHLVGAAAGAAAAPVPSVQAPTVPMRAVVDNTVDMVIPVGGGGTRLGWWLVPIVVVVAVLAGVLIAWLI